MRILIADDERAARHGMVRALTRTGHNILEADDGQAALDAIRAEAPDLVFLDLTMPVLDGLGVLRELGTPPCEVVVVTAHDSVASAVECMRLGAADYLTKPFEVSRLRAIAGRVAERIALRQRVADLESRLDERQACGALVGVSRPMRELYRQVERAARAPADVLVRGETGTGKELVARELHRLSGRAGPFVAVNTAAVAASLAESELFGHVRGAFTGADATRPGVFEQAHRGTLFLDEIGDMPPAAQAKVLRALQERAIVPVGSARPVAVDVRVVCATHHDLARAVTEGGFRQDLYYRIKGIEIVIPPLRARREDVVVLARHFLDQLSARTGRAHRLADDAVDRLLGHAWPGNVRELEHVVTAAATMSESGTVRAADLGLPVAMQPADVPGLDTLLDLPLTEAKVRLGEWFECTAIEAALRKHAGNVSAAARQLGIHRQSLQQKMAQLGIVRFATGERSVTLDTRGSGDDGRGD